MSTNSMDLFSEACGATGPLVWDLKEDGRPGSTQHVFRQPFLRVGRSEDAEVALPSGSAGRRHAYFQVIDGRVYCIDLDPRSGALVGGAPLRSLWVDHTRTIRIGPIALRLLSGDRSSDDASVQDARPGPLSPQYSSEHPCPGAILEFRADEGKSLLWRMEPAIALIGRAPACAVKLQHSTVSLFHCSLVRTPRGVWVVDLLSRDGVIVNGERKRCCWLCDGDEFHLGPFSARLRYDTPPARDRLGFGEFAPLPALPERVPAASGVLMPLGENGAGQDLAPVLQQVSFMQEQMFDQFKQAMSLMAETFGAMHRDQMELVRAELAQMRRLSDEMRELRDRYEGAPTTASATATAALERPRARLRSALPPLGFDAVELREGPPEPKAAETSGAVSEAHGERPMRDPKDVQAFVSQRLAEYERERQSCWNRIVRVVTSLRSDA